MLIVVVKGNIEKSLKELKGKVIKTKQTKKLLKLKEFEKKSVTNLKTDSNITNIETTAGQNIKEGEKRKKLAEKYQIDEEVINEMASIKQLKSELARQGKEAELKAVTAAERAALDSLKADPTITPDGRLKGYVPTLKKELLNTHNIKLQDLLSVVAGKAEDDGVKFSGDIATNTIEKDAANQLTGKEPGQRGRKATEKPAKPAKAEKAPKAKAEKAPATKPADDEDAASKSAGSDETAKELASTPEEKKVKFNQFLASVKKNKDDKAKIDGILKLAKDKFKFTKTMVDDLKRAAGREVEA
jgi:hypothetical protein